MGSALNSFKGPQTGGACSFSPFFTSDGRRKGTEGVMSVVGDVGQEGILIGVSMETHKDESEGDVTLEPETGLVIFFVA